MTRGAGSRERATASSLPITGALPLAGLLEGCPPEPPDLYRAGTDLGSGLTRLSSPIMALGCLMLFLRMLHECFQLSPAISLGLRSWVSDLSLGLADPRAPIAVALQVGQAPVGRGRLLFALPGHGEQIWG